MMIGKIGKGNKMDNFEKVEKIREKANVSYEEAKQALEASNYDMLDAIVYLERQGKVKAPEQQVVVTESSNSGDSSEEFKKTQSAYERECRKRPRDHVKNFFKKCVKLLKKSLQTSFVVERRGERVLSMPVLVLIIFILFLFWFAVPCLILGLFCDCRYRFEGINKGFDINDFCDKCADGAENLKKSFTENNNETENNNKNE